MCTAQHSTITLAIIIIIMAITVTQHQNFVTGEIYFKKGSPHVKLNEHAVLSGKLLFSREGRPFSGFMGIPYAHVPERFAESELVTEPEWDGVKSFAEYGPMCAQPDFSQTDAEMAVGDEDCLSLNVFVPMNSSTGKERGYPVMVWIHGGAFVFDGSATYGPEYFMDEDVILVSINYRLGVFGFLGLNDAIVPGNNGLKDIVVALRWVQQHIMKFSGNPGKVTIFGESAGGAAVHYLLLSPTTSAGLFHRAISQSGSGHEKWGYHPNARKNAVDIATNLKCPTSASDPSQISSEEILSCLKGVSVGKLNKAQCSLAKSWPINLAPLIPFGPTIEPANNASSSSSSLTPFLTKSPYEILITDNNNKNNQVVDVPWMIGATEAEGAIAYASVVHNDKKLLQQLNSEWDTIAPQTIFSFGSLAAKEEHLVIADKIYKFYFGSRNTPISAENREALVNLYSDEFIAYGVYKAAVETVKRVNRKSPVFYYEYGWLGPLNYMGLFMSGDEEGTKRVGHADDLLLQFNMKTLPEPVIKPDTEQEKFSKNFIKLWVSFAIHGEPKYNWGNSVSRKWKELSKKEARGEAPLRLYRIDANPGQIESPHKERMAFWDQLHKDHFEKFFMSSNPSSTINKTEL